jgi:hypothetical protein
LKINKSLKNQIFNIKIFEVNYEINIKKKLGFGVDSQLETLEILIVSTEIFFLKPMPPKHFLNLNFNVSRNDTFQLPPTSTAVNFLHEAFVSTVLHIWITDPQSIEPQYLNETNNARY